MVGISWTHLIRFIADEDGQIHLGQLVDTTRDVGLDNLEGRVIKAYHIDGTVFDGIISDKIFSIKQVRLQFTLASTILKQDDK